MYSINNTYTVQWVGPFHSMDEIDIYKNNEKTIDMGYYNFYCFEAKKRVNTKWKRYIGVHHKEDGIDKRLNNQHEHYSEIKDYKYKNIWIGTFGNKKDQKYSKIEDVETLYIRAYKDELAINDKKKKARIITSICVVNLWYNTHDVIKRNRRDTISFMDDVVFYEAESDSFFKGYLSKNRSMNNHMKQE